VIQRQLEEIESVFAALGIRADPDGRALSRGEMTAGRCGAFARPTTTGHLQVLETAGLLSCVKRGRTRVYRLERAKLDAVTQWIAWFDHSHKVLDDG
jgi:DNA-binding transcriptional ArsR family regulator